MESTSNTKYNCEKDDEINEYLPLKKEIDKPKSEEIKKLTLIERLKIM
jgi:hypothetical protein